MRIAYVSTDPGVPVFGRKGCSVHVQEVIRAWRQRGDAVELFASRLGDDVPEDLLDVTIHELERPRCVDASKQEAALLATNDAIRSALVTAGQFDLVYERHALWSFAAMEAARELEVCGVLEVNAPLIEEQRRHRQLIAEDAAEDAAQRAYDAASAIVAVSDPVAQYVRKRLELTDKVHVVMNGVNPERFHPAAASAVRSGRPFTVGFVGTMKPWHGLDALVDAFEMFHGMWPDSQLLLVGDGPYRQLVEKRIADSASSLGDAVCLVGAVPPAAVPSWVAKFDVATACPPLCDDYYFSPLKVFEYMAAGIPVVASRVGQINQVVQHGHTGLLCTPGDSAEVAAALLTLARSPELRRTMGCAGRAQVLRQHAWSSVVERIAQIAAGNGVRHESTAAPQKV